MKKILSLALAAIMVLCLSVSVFADYDPAVEIGLFLGDPDNGGWTAMDTVTVDKPGTYTLSWEGDAKALNWILIRTVEQNANTSIPAGTPIKTTSVKVDGVDLTFGGSTEFNSKTEFGGTFEVQYFVHAIGVDNCDNEPETGSKIEVTFVVDPDNAVEAAPADIDNEEAPVEDGTAADNNTVEPEAPAAETPAAAPAAPATGLALAVVPAVMALAAVAVSKKR